jgi:hypothetical protein
MDCPKAETAMMHYIEKTLNPAAARDLARHVMRCEPCRELYMTMDIAAEMLDSPPAEAPEGFTESVMGRVMAFAAHPAEEPQTESVGSPIGPVAATPRNTMLRILWGLSGIALGYVLLLVLNPHWAASVAVQNGLHSVTVFLNDIIAWLARTDITQALINSGLGIVALVFAGLIAALLYGLHRGESARRESQA